MISAALGMCLISIAAYSAWRTISYAKAGKAFVWSDLSGRGVAGEARKDSEPGFWRLNVIANLSGSLGLGVVGLALIVWALQ